MADIDVQMTHSEEKGTEIQNEMADNDKETDDLDVEENNSEEEGCSNRDVMTVDDMKKYIL